MKKLLLSYLSILILSTISMAQTELWEWRGYPGPNGAQDQHSIAVDASGNTYGAFEYSAFGYIMIDKIDASGNFVWADTIPLVAGSDTLSFGNVYGVVIDHQGYIYIGGSAQASYPTAKSAPFTGPLNDFNQSPFIAKYASDGTRLWTRSYRISGTSIAVRSFKMAPNGNLYLVTRGTADETIFVDQNGNLLGSYPNDLATAWTAVGDAAGTDPGIMTGAIPSISSSGHPTGFASGHSNYETEDLVIGKSGDIYLYHTYTRAGNDHQMFARVTSPGNVVWARQYRESHEWGSIVLDQYENLYTSTWTQIAGHNDDSLTLVEDEAYARFDTIWTPQNYNGINTLLTKWDSLGNIGWSKYIESAINCVPWGSDALAIDTVRNRLALGMYDDGATNPWDWDPDTLDEDTCFIDIGTTVIRPIIQLYKYNGDLDWAYGIATDEASLQIAANGTAFGPTGDVAVVTFDLANQKEGLFMIDKTPLKARPEITAQTDASCNGYSDGSLTVDPGGNITPYTYAWSSGGSSTTETGLPAGTYSVTITGNGGSPVNIVDATITEPIAVAAMVSVTSNVDCNGASTGWLEAYVSGAAQTNYTYAWSNSSSSAANNTIPAGSYTVTITDGSSCSSTASGTITEPAALSISGTATNVMCNGGTDGSINITVTGGTTGYSFNWDNGAGTGEDPSGLMANSYTVTVTDANSCTISGAYTVTEPSAISVTLSTVDPTCNGTSDGSINATVSGGTSAYTFSWNNGAGTSQNVSGLTANTYTLTVTDANSCVTIANATLTDPSVLMASTTVTDVDCNGNSTGSIAMDVSGGTVGTGYTYAWDNGAGTAEDPNGLVANAYSVTITDANSCTLTISSTVSEPTALAVTATGTNVLCNGGSTGTATVTAAGGPSTSYSYMWSDGQTVAGATGLIAGNYDVTVSSNGCSTTGSVSLTEPTVLAASVSCIATSGAGSSDGSSMASATGGTTPYMYDWGSGATTSDALTGLAAGSVDLTVTDANGCTVVANCSVTDDPCANVAVSISGTDLTCNMSSDGTVMASMTASSSTSFSYVWSNGATDASQTGLSSGSYDVTITDGLSCTAMGSTTITEPTELMVSVTATNPSCGSGSDGSVSVVATGGPSTAYSYEWSDGATDASISGLMGGEYNLTVSSGACTEIPDTISLATPMAQTITDNVSICDGESYMAGGASQTTAGTYYDAYINTLGCDSIVETVLSVNSNPNVTANADNTEICEGESIILTGSGATSYSWNNGVTDGISFQPTAGATEFIVTGTTAQGCSDSDTIEVNTAPAPSVSVSQTPDVANCRSTLTISSSGANAYTWTTDGGSTQTTTALESTVLITNSDQVYSVVATGGGSCVSQPFSITITGDPGCEALAINEHISKGFEFYPNPNHGTFVINFKQRGNYNLTLLNAIGQTIYSTNVINQTTQEVRLGDIESGVYFLRVGDGEFERTERIVIK